MRVTLWLIGAGALLAAIGASWPESAVSLFSEEGPIERGSEVLWLGLGACILVWLRPPTLPVIAGVLVCLACAAREADFHKRFTGYSVLKFGFYLDGGFPLSHRMLAGALVGLLALSTLILLLRLAELAREQGRPAPAWLKVAVIGLVTLVITKVMDRSPKLLEEEAGILLPVRALGAVAAVEEGLESVLPVVFGVAVLSYRRLRKGAARPAPGVPDWGRKEI